MTTLRSTLLTACLFAAAPLAGACAQTNLIQNSGFTQSGATGTGTVTAGFQPDYNGTLYDWTNNNGASNNGNNGVGYNFVFLGNNGNAGATGDDGALKLWDSLNGGASTWNGNGPSNANYIAADGVYQPSSLATSVSVIAGVQYKVSFLFAGAQQYGFNGPTTEAWFVGLGDTLTASLAHEQETAIVSTPTNGFTGWEQASFFFTADTTGTEILSFLAYGTPNGEPPFTLLADPTMFVPEPGALSLACVGFATLLVARRRRAPSRA
jgi:hypothetical protein